MGQKEYYDSKASGFDAGSFFSRENLNHLKKIRAICGMLEMGALDERGGRLLEVGTGTGIHARHILENFINIEYVGIDISQGMLKESVKRLAGHGTLILGDGEHLPFRAGSFNAAFISGSLHHFRNPRDGLSELARVVESRGRILIMEPYWLFPTNMLAALANSAERGILGIREKNFKKWAVSAGLRDIQVGHLLYTPPIPEDFHAIYGLIDEGARRAPLFSKLSIMLYLYAEK